MDEFLGSLINQTISKELFEVIICDQNKIDALKLIIAKHAKCLKILHIKSNNIGLSLNRNVGIKYANGNIIAFPDDDCTYYPTTLETVLNEFEESDDKIVLGRIYDRASNNNILKKWPPKRLRVNFYNFYSLTTSITIFTNRSSVLFNERFGVGAEYSSNEDTLYILENLLAGKCIQYVPDIEVWHPEQKHTQLRFDRVYSYGVGFGKLLRHMPIMPKVYYYLLFNIYYIYRGVDAILHLNSYRIKWAGISIYSRNRSFFQSSFK